MFLPSPKTGSNIHLIFLYFFFPSILFALFFFSCLLYKHDIFVVYILLNSLSYCSCYSVNLLQLDLCVIVLSGRILQILCICDSITSHLESSLCAVDIPDWPILCAFMDNWLINCNLWSLTYVKFWLLSPGYSVAVLSTMSSVYFVAGAPRSNYTGRVVVYDVDSDGNIAIVQSQRGEQASIFWSWIQTFRNLFLLTQQ